MHRVFVSITLRCRPCGRHLTSAVPIQGGSKFGAGYNYDELVSSNCTTAGIRVDNSNYWEPQLYWLEANGSFTAVPTVDRFYYFLSRVVRDLPSPCPKSTTLIDMFCRIPPSLSSRSRKDSVYSRATRSTRNQSRTMPPNSSVKLEQTFRAAWYVLPPIQVYRIVSSSPFVQGLDSFNFPRDCPWGLKTAFHFPSW